MRRFLFRAALVLLATTIVNCGSTSPARQGPPAYVAAADNYRGFDTVAALRNYLGYDADAPVLVSAHRGGPVPGYPENAIATFERALRYAPVLVECDIRRSSDGVLVMMHDETLDRTTTGEGAIADRTLAELRSLLLVDQHAIVTPFRIPTLEETLAWADGRAILFLDVKEDVRPRDVVDAIRRHHAARHVVIIVYRLEDVYEYEQLMAGLTYSVPVETAEQADELFRSDLSLKQAIAWTGVGVVNDQIISRLHERGVRAMLGTFGTVDERARTAGREVYEALIERGVDVIATDHVQLAADAAARFEFGSVR